jgi:hypothetical protein
MDNKTNTGMDRPGMQPGNIGNWHSGLPNKDQLLIAEGEFFEWHSRTMMLELTVDNANGNPFKTIRHLVSPTAIWVKNNKYGVQNFRPGDKCECFSSGEIIQIVISLASLQVYAG